MCSIARSRVLLAPKVIAPKQLIPGAVSLRWFSDEAKATKTPLFDLHTKYGGRVVDFAGFLLPVQYSDLSLSESHLFTRKSASIFDVSHMLQTNFLTVFLNDKGGIIDDLIVTKVNAETLYVVSNAGRMKVDKEHMRETSEIFRKKGNDVNVEFWETSQRALIALQGPKAAAVLQNLTDIKLEDLTFMTSKLGKVAGVECRVTRCGYTGEDGVEISIPAANAEHVTEALLQSSDVKLAGLGARDSLRLEAGLCLYGNDIDESVTPVEANLTWLIAKRRRTDDNFPGSSIILRQIKEGVSKRRVGIILQNGPPARKSAVLKDGKTSETIGSVTSGCPAPSLGVNIAMGYVSEALKKAGTELLVNIRGKDIPCVVAKMPFVPSKYYIKK
ncbi:hypothetical protein HW555_006312 [Spodoptera exigua]|uniref:Aminomethyltransferase n=1 Tax=Spodoptera exigua TaxID=7107 RepID=A0A835L5I4_SPOEX|nr:hypothetical protein HW555_006312 [Spodoptera exigua]